MDINKLKQLLKKEEDTKLDFKARLSLALESEKKELTRDVTAIANSRGGRGYMIFGIEDKTKKVLGINPGEFTEEQIQQVIYNRCDPPVPVALDLVEIEGKVVAVLTIFKSTNKPHQMIQNGTFYIRRGSTTDTARRSEIANLLQENGLVTYEATILRNTSMEDLDIDSINAYLKALNIVVSKELNESLLEAMGLIGRGAESESFCCTVGGILRAPRKGRII